MHCFFVMAVAAGLFTYMRRHSPRQFGFGRGWRRVGGWGCGSPERFAEMLAYRLDASPEQRRVIRDEFERLAEGLHELRREVRLSGSDIASALRTEHFDEEMMGHAFSRQDDRIRAARGTLVEVLARIHDVLDPRQRTRLASIMDHRGL